MYLQNAFLACLLVAISISPTVHGFNVGVTGTKCNTDPTKGEINDPCGSLYDAVCRGKHCACPAGSHEDSALKRCVSGEATKKTGGTQSAGGGGSYDPFDDIIDSYPGTGKKEPSAPPAPPPAGPPPQQPPRQPPYNPSQPAYNPNQPGYNPNQPGYNPNQPGYNPNQPGYNPNQPGYNPNQPGYNPNQPGYNPNRPGYNPNQPGYNPNQPGYNPNRPGSKRPGVQDNNVGEKAGGGIGGGLGLLIIIGLIYFCCCRGGKGKEVLNKFGGGRFQGIPFIGGRQQQVPPGVQMNMQQSAPVQQDPNFGSQHTYIPPGGGAPQPDPSQYGAPPAGGYAPMMPGNPYPPQPGYAPYPPQDGGLPPMQPPPPGMPMQPPPPGMPMQPPPPGMPMHPVPPGMPGQPNPPYPPQAAPYVATAPPEGFIPDGQQPPPYTPQYQPNAPPPQ